MKLADMHCHILPGIDDGAPDEEMSTRMLRLEAAEGVSSIIFTPHFKPEHHNASPRTVLKLTARMQEIAIQESLGIKVYAGNEILFFDEVPTLLEHGDVLTLAGSDHALIEFYPTELYDRIRSALYEVLAAGFTPIVAHVERYLDIIGYPERVNELIALGAEIQVNASTVMGKYGFSVRQIVRRLISRRSVHYIATDAHDDRRRAPLLSGCAHLIEKKYGTCCAGRILHDNALNLIYSGSEEK
ncbi:MAG: protein-tyrosine-phosphatase [Lachnospiraceae bacterium]|nr:protein-tyrosine-phosphatase [Lachnospiraceae bacterium]